MARWKRAPRGCTSQGVVAVSSNSSHQPAPSRRQFIKTAVATSAAAATLAQVPFVHAGGTSVLKIGLIGCGGPGTGAAPPAPPAAQDAQPLPPGGACPHRG